MWQVRLAGLRASNIADSWQPLVDSNDCIEVFHTVSGLCTSWLSSSTRRRIAVDISTGKKSIIAAIGAAGSSIGADVLHFPCTELTRNAGNAFAMLADKTVERSFFGDLEVNGGAQSTASDICNMSIQLQIGTRLFQHAHWNSCAQHFKQALRYQNDIAKKAVDEGVADMYSIKERELSQLSISDQQPSRHSVQVGIYAKVASIYKHWNNLAFERAYRYTNGALELLQEESWKCQQDIEQKLQGRAFKCELLLTRWVWQGTKRRLRQSCQ